MPDSFSHPCDRAIFVLRWLLALVCAPRTLARPRADAPGKDMLTMTRVLFAVSGKDYWTLADGTRHPCGYWPEELAVPHEVFARAGFDITIATPGAVTPTADEAGFSAAMNGGSEEPGRRYRAYLDSISGDLSHPVAL